MTDTEVVSTWRELSARHAAIVSDLERELQEHHELGVSEFEVLDRLVEGICLSPNGKFRVQELAAGVSLSQSALSRLIARLEKSGFVMRSMCSDDRRGVFVNLTDAGRIRHSEALPTQRRVLRAHLEPESAATTG
ncbi:MarR family winged helix-turn-helix transcriptional regulator [Herbidospora mongoliensis]|uniref:MarR family winged helix-turn-helix transcriptional regulator n=1 Tax=Herbidospora mongoliensis TaxID=688067 RepID=UPI00082C4F84|nr:MarR family transcriptional regulator [Herbidospora mongoliensis]